jgi:hypothetical protein
MKTNLLNFLVRDHQDEEEGMKVLFMQLHFGLKILAKIF